MCKLIGHEWVMKERKVDSFLADMFCRRCGYSRKIGLKDFVENVKTETKNNKKLRKMLYG